MADVVMPALIGNDPLAFLAALGVLRLATTELGWDATLAWPNGPRNGAVLGGSPSESTTDTLAEALFGIVERARAAGQLIPGVEGFPPTKQGGAGSDPVKDLTLQDRSGLARTALDCEPQFGDWLVAVVALAARDTDDGRDRLTAAFVRPTGQVTFDRSLKAGRDDVRPDDLRAALTLWGRVDGVTGNYFDQRAIRDEFVGMHTSGQMKNFGVPGAAWLALMALPFLPVRTSLSGKAMTVGFQRRRVGPTRMVWPIWTQPQSVFGVAALIDHPAVTRAELLPRDNKARRRAPIATSLRSLGISAVFAANRRPGPQGGDGALGPSEAIASAAGPSRRRP